MTNLQRFLIVVGSAILFQVAGVLANVGADDLADWKGWLAGAAVGIANAIGVAVLALKTSGGLSVEEAGE